MSLGWFIVYSKGSQVTFSLLLLSLKIDFIKENSADPEELQHYATFSLDLNCFIRLEHKLFL